MKHLLVPIDFSIDSINALELAITYAEKLSYSIRLIHVIKDNSYLYPGVDQSLVVSKNNKVVDNLKFLVKKYSPICPNGIEYRVRTGKIYNEIANQAKYGEAEMLVLGTHGVSGFEELWLGSNAMKIVNNSACPVITVRNNYKRHKVERIVVPIDDTPETRQKIPYVANIAKMFNATLHIVQVSETKKEAVLSRISTYAGQVLSFLEHNNIMFESELLIGSNITDITIEYALKYDADLITIMTEQSESPKNIWLGPYAQQMVNHSPIPVLTIQPF